MTFRTAQISDTHLSDVKPFFVANLFRVAPALVADPPELVLNTGDISLDGANCDAYGIKQVGYVEYDLHGNGTHGSRFVAAASAVTLDVADFPSAYGPTVPAEAR
jgi:hypothetical protein